MHFYPRPPRGGRPGFSRTLSLSRNFYPRPPRGGRPPKIFTVGIRCLFLSTPSARRATASDLGPWPPDPISIHALREEGDRAGCRKHTPSTYFYPRPPRGGRPSYRVRTTADVLFLSTPSARRATSHDLASLREVGVFLSTPSARRATAKTETKSLFSYKLYNILHEFRRALIYSGSKNYPNHAKRLKNLVRRCRKDAENSPFAPGRKTQNNSRPSCSKGG